MTRNLFVSLAVPFPSAPLTCTYLSAQPLSPMNSCISSKFLHVFQRLPQIISGHDANWPMIQREIRLRVPRHYDSSTVFNAPGRLPVFGYLSVAFLQGGKHIISGSIHNVIQLWDAETGEALEELRPSFHFLSASSFNHILNRSLFISSPNTRLHVFGCLRPSTIHGLLFQC